MNLLDALTIGDLKVVIDEYVRHVQDQQGHAEGRTDRNAKLRKLRAELARRVLEAVFS